MENKIVNQPYTSVTSGILSIKIKLLILAYELETKKDGKT